MENFLPKDTITPVKFLFTLARPPRPDSEASLSIGWCSGNPTRYFRVILTRSRSIRPAPVRSRRDVDPDGFLEGDAQRATEALSRHLIAESVLPLDNAECPSLYKPPAYFHAGRQLDLP